MHIYKLGFLQKAEIRQMEKQIIYHMIQKRCYKSIKETVEVCEYAIKNNINSKYNKSRKLTIKMVIYQIMLISYY